MVRESMYTVYVLKSEKDGKHYIGYTADLTKRLQEHNSGKTISTRWRRPFKIVYHEEFESVEEAKSREKFLKSGKGREELKSLIIGAVPKW